VYTYTPFQLIIGLFRTRPRVPRLLCSPVSVLPAPPNTPRGPERTRVATMIRLPPRHTSHYQDSAGTAPSGTPPSAQARPLPQARGTQSHRTFWPLQDIAITNIVWYMTYKRGVGGGVVFWAIGVRQYCKSAGNAGGGGGIT